MRKYKNENEICELVERFENCTVSRDEWKHAEHLVVALYYVEKHGLDEAIDKMRSGIFRLLDSFGVDLEKEMPYHETLTVFWMRTVFAYCLMRPDESLSEKASGLIASYDKDHPLRFYSNARLFSNEARSIYIEPDIAEQEFASSETFITTQDTLPI